jgi:hypothetical protein
MSFNFSLPHAVLILAHSYGADGKAIIVSMLEAMFPESTFNASQFAPLPWRAVIYEFLLPETLLILMQADLRLSLLKCLHVLRGSCTSANEVSDSHADGLLADILCIDDKSTD